MKLYTCRFGTIAGGLGPASHPCGRAAKALDDAGYSYELEEVPGGTIGLVWTLPQRGRDRAEIERLSGQRGLPILVLDDGEVVVGSGTIAEWAKQNPPADG